MKNIGLFVLFTLVTTMSNAQSDDNSNHSPSEIFAARKGAIMEKRYDEVGKAGNLNIQIEYLSDLTTSDKLQCVRFDIQTPNTTNDAYSLLDTNEVNELIGFVKYATASVTNRPPVDPNTEITFTSKYNNQIGCFWQANNGWVLFFRTDALDAATEVDMGQSNIEEFLRIIRMAKLQIKGQ